MQEGHWKRTALALALFGCAFGYVEAAVVCYLRALHFPAARELYADRAANQLFPLVPAIGDEQRRIVRIEVVREGATLVMFAAVALALARDAGGWAAAVAIAFGAWDIAFYAFLRILLGWPESLLTWDILFLLPVPWTAPVLAPVVAAASMMGAGAWQLRSPARVRPRHWCGIVLGASVMVLSFTLDYRNVAGGGMPHAFRWDVFAAGEAIGLGSYGLACRTAGSRRARSRAV